MDADAVTREDNRSCRKEDRRCLYSNLQLCTLEVTSHAEAEEEEEEEEVGGGDS